MFVDYGSVLLETRLENADIAINAARIIAH